MDNKGRSLRVVMLPWLAHGHISPYLELAKKLSKRNINIYLCSTLINLTSIKKNFKNDHYPTIHLTELNLPSLPNLPPHYHTTNGLPPHLAPSLIKSFAMAAPNFSLILDTLTPDLLILDMLQSWVPPLALSRRIPTVFFQTASVVSLSFFLSIINHPGLPFPFPEIYLRDIEIQQLRDMFPEEDGHVNHHVLPIFDSLQQSHNIILVKSLDDIEAKYLDYLSFLCKKKVVTVGLLVQEADIDDEDKQNDIIIQWLSKKDESSTVFICFGSEYFLSEEQKEEIAYGLELSGFNFIWAIRFPKGERKEIKGTLPQGFLERTRERGMVVEGWAPQAKILGHSSIGGFVSHCGWSSVTESMKFGVPIIAMPIKYDQPLNARLVEEVGVGVEVMKGKNGEVKREELARVIKEVVVEESGECVRNKAKELSQKIRMKGEEEIDVLVVELAQLCEKSKNLSIAGSYL